MRERERMRERGRERERERGGERGNLGRDSIHNEECPDVSSAFVHIR